MEKDFNPFLLMGYQGPGYFCDRQAETAILRGHIKNNRNTSLFAMRRLGKTGLIHHVFDGYSKSLRIACLYVNILGTRNLKEFTDQLATVIYNRFPENKGIGKRLFEFIRSFHPVITYDTLSGAPELNLGLREPRQYERTIQQLFTSLDRQNIKVVFAIDEFQQVLEYPEKNTEAILRTVIQQLRHTQFIFCGSDQKMMLEIFNSAKRPFFASSSHVHLDFIGHAEYASFIASIFKQHKRKITEDSIDYILEWTVLHTYYTQYFCNFLFASPLKQITLADVQNSALKLLKQQESNFYQYRNLLTGAQWNLLRAIAKESRVYKPHSKEFISTYNLGTSSMITRGLESLVEKEMIYFNIGVKTPYYEVYDKFLMRWLQFS